MGDRMAHSRPMNDGTVIRETSSITKSERLTLRAGESKWARRKRNMVNDLGRFVEHLQQNILREARGRYSETVIDHWIHPRNWGVVSGPDGCARVTGSCGDTMQISFRANNGSVAECRFSTDGCGAAVACGSVVTELIVGRPLNAVRKITKESILRAVGGLPDSDIHCAVLAASSVQEAIRNYDTLSADRSNGADMTANPFNSLAQRYDAWFDRERGRRIFSVEQECIRELLVGMPRPWLEVGVGTGRFGAVLDIDAGLDPSPAVLRYASERGIRTRIGRAESLPWRDNSFGVILFIVTICFVSDPRKALSECARVLRHDGCVIVGLIRRDSPWGREYARKGKEGHPFYSAATFYASEEIIRMAQEAGFCLERARSCLFEGPDAGVNRYQGPREGIAKGAGFVGMRLKREGLQ